MPFDSAAEAVKKHPNLSKYSAKAQRAFVHAFNSAYESGKDEGTCFAIGYSAAKKADGKSSFVKMLDSSSSIVSSRSFLNFSKVKSRRFLFLYR